jgi:CHAD domain-containing protein
MGKNEKNAICIFGASFMLDQLNNLQNENDGALIGEDIEYIHRMRVASRRLRNAMTCFKDCLPAKKVKTWGDEIRRITHSLGAARDLDIQIACINHLYNDQLDAKIKPGYQRILLRLEQKRSLVQQKVTKSLTRLQKDQTLSKMQSYFIKLTTQTENAYLYTPSLYERAFKNIHTSLEDFLSYQEAVQIPENIKQLHAMRIAGKQLRYSLEIFSPIYDTALVPYITIMKDLQDLLGNIHDDDVWVAWLPKFIEEEQERIQDYFGNTRPLKRLLTGINHLIENRQQDRDETYNTFLLTWETLLQENGWESLKAIIRAPINLEAALEHLGTPKQAEVVNDAESTEEIDTDVTVQSPYEETSETTASPEESPNQVDENHDSI